MVVRWVVGWVEQMVDMLVVRWVVGWVEQMDTWMVEYLASRSAVYLAARWAVC